MKKTLTVVAAVLAMLTALIGPASAQGSNGMDFNQWKDKVDSGYMRIYGTDATMSEHATPESGKPMMVAATVMDFKNEDDLKGHLKDVQDSVGKSGFTLDKEAESVDGIGDEAMKSWGVVDMQGTKMDASVVTARKGDKLIVVIVFGTKDTKLAEDTAKDMAGKDAGSGNVEFKDDGHSSGGVFDMMPSTDKVDGLKDMKPMMDLNMFGMASPVASPMASATPKA